MILERIQKKFGQPKQTFFGFLYYFICFVLQINLTEST